MKFKCIVEYEYPVEHKHPIKADIYLHGDKVTTREIKTLQEELEKIKENIQFIADKCLPNNLAEEFEVKGLKTSIEIIDTHISRLKGE